MRLLLIHGRAQGNKDSVQLKDEWMSALRSGLTAAKLALPEKIHYDVPFYGKRLDQFVEQLGLEVDEVATAKGVGGDDEFAEFARQIALEAKDARGISDAMVRDNLIARHGQQASQKGPLDWEWVQSIISILDYNLPGATELVFSRFLRDVFLYTRRNVVRKQIDKIVAENLTDEPTVVVGHSLGSVVGYNVLWSAGKSSILAYVTLGSPLGIRGISSTLSTPLKNVGGRGGWYNAYDRRDVVALNPLDKKFFNVTPAISNRDDLVNTTNGHHGIVSYLDKLPVAQKIVASFHQ